MFDFGAKYDLGLVDENDEGAFEISISKSSVTAGTTYSKTSTASSYYYLLGCAFPNLHRLTVQIGSTESYAYLDTTSIII